MREIKFRGKPVDNEYGEWVFGYFSLNSMSLGGTAPFIFDGEYEYKVDPETVGQYTGLKDRNGKEIFEGDIQEGGRFDKEIKIVRYDTRQARFKAVPLSLFKANAGNGGWTGYDVRDYAVIGNIYENPELLEVPHE